MAELEVVTEDAPAETPPAAGPARVVKMAIVAGAVALGLAAGALGVAPRLLSGTPASSESASADKSAKKKAGKTGEAEVVELKSLVTNPAGAEGQHFIMATVALKTHDREAAAYLQNNETLVKDAVVGTLSSLSMDDLSRPDARERIKTLIAGRAGELVDHPDAFIVYLPEFVVQ